MKQYTVDFQKYTAICKNKCLYRNVNDKEKYIYSLSNLARRWRQGWEGKSDASVFCFTKYRMCCIVTEKYLTSDDYKDLHINSFPNIY